MKHSTLKIFGFAIILAGTISFFAFKKTASKNELIVKAMMKGLQNDHFLDKEIDNDFSKSVFNLYIERLDYNKKFFIQKDIDELKKWETEIDEELTYSTTQFYQRSMEILKERTLESQAYYREILNTPFDFKKGREHTARSKENSFREKQGRPERTMEACFEIPDSCQA